MKKLRVGIIGGAGYTGGELARILVHHEGVEIKFIQSRSQAGKPVSSIHADLTGVTELKFSEMPADLTTSTIDVLFLALGHGESRGFMEKNQVGRDVCVIDLSQDFRLAASSTCGERTFIYGLPEINRDQTKGVKSIANPGCFATAIQLSLLPLSKNGDVKTAVVTGITGSTGAGQKLAETSHFSFRDNNVQAYKALSHQHVKEIEETLRGTKVQFIPWRGPFARGIFVSSVIETKRSLQENLSLYRAFYEAHPFVHVSDRAIDLKSVVNTNRALIELNQEGNQLVIHTAIDNLTKGASGQAVHNMNLSFGLPESQGLNLKGSAF